jgi:hypothetical protein
MNIALSLATLLLSALLQAQSLAKAEEVEIKFVVKEAEVEKALRVLALDKGAAERRTVYFFDTKDLSLFKQAGASVILRARTTQNKTEGETTVKLRSRGKLVIEEEWRQERRKGEKLERKFEKDQVVTKPVVESYSLDDQENSKAIQQAVAGRQSVKKIFSSNQEDLVEAKTKPRLDWDKLEPLGPIKVLKWELEAGGLDLVAERWEFGDHPATLEVSTKVSASAAEETTSRLVDFLHERGLRQNPHPETKTKEVLEYFTKN